MMRQKTLPILLLLLALLPLAYAAAGTRQGVDFSSGPISHDPTPVSFGWAFTPATDLTISSLGYYDENGDGFADPHRVGIFAADGEVPLVSTTLAAGKVERLEGKYRYRAIPPFTLQAGRKYVIAGTSPGPADGWAYAVSDLVFDPALSVTQPASLYIYQGDALLRRPTGSFGYNLYAGPNFEIAGGGPAAVVPVYYGYNPVDNGGLFLTGFTDGTSYSVIDLDARTLVRSGTLNRAQVASFGLGGVRHFKVAASAPLSVFLGFDCCNYGGSAAYPNVAGASKVGREFVFTLPVLSGANEFIVFAYEAASVTIRNAAGDPVKSVDLPQFGFLSLTGAPLAAGVPYTLTATGNVSLQSNSGNGFTVIPASTGQEVGRQFLFATNGWGNGTVAVLAYEDTQYVLTNLDNGQVITSSGVLSRGRFAFGSGFGQAHWKLESTGNVAVWAGGNQGENSIAGMGDDVAFDQGLGGREIFIHTQALGGFVFAPYDDTTITIETLDATGTIVATDTQNRSADGFVDLPARNYYRLTSNNPITAESIGAGGMDDWGDVLPATPLVTRATPFDLFISPADFLASPKDGAVSGVPVTLSAVVRNASDIDGTADVVFYRNAVAPENRIGGQTGVSVPRQGQTPVSTQWNTAGIDGPFTLIAQLENVSLPQAFTGNDQASLTGYAVLPAPDLQVSAGHASAEALTGEAFDVTWTDRNAGRGGASGPWIDRILLSTDDQLGNDLQLAEVPFDGTLGAGSEQERTRSITLTRDQVPQDGPAFILIVTDAGSQIVEGGVDGNNFRAIPIALFRGYSMSGNVRQGSVGVADVQVTAGTKNALTDNTGAYRLTGLKAGSYEVRPAKSGLVFTPPSKPVTVAADVTGVDFTAAPAPPALKSLTLAPATVRSGRTVRGTVQLTGKAPAVGALVRLTAAPTGVVTLPRTVTIRRGKTVATFTVRAGTVRAQRQVTVTARYLESVKTARLTVRPQ